MSSNTVGSLKRFLAQFPDDAVVYGYEEVAGIDMDGTGPSAIVVAGETGGVFPTGDYPWTHNREPIIAAYEAEEASEECAFVWTCDRGRTWKSGSKEDFERDVAAGTCPIWYYSD